MDTYVHLFVWTARRVDIYILAGKCAQPEILIKMWRKQSVVRILLHVFYLFRAAFTET